MSVERTGDGGVAPAPGTKTPADASAPLLEISHLATGYGDLRVVWDVSLEVKVGEVTALLGRNGAGKTTTLRAVAGLNRAAEGTIRLRGENINTDPVHRRIRKGIGLVQENKRVFHRRTIEDNLLLGGYTRGLRRRGLSAAVDEIYEIFPVLATRASTVAGQLSGGQQQMLAIGQALMAKPALLMLDEPSAGLAPAIVAEVFAAVAALKKTGLGILLVEQAVEAAMTVADHVAVLDVGRVVMSGPAAEIDDLTVLRDAYFGRSAKPTP
jgi:branched-chain amino acid transport system ATP-binding protein